MRGAGEARLTAEVAQDIDITEQARQEYEDDTETRLRDPLGELHSPYSDEFYREPTAEELSAHRPMVGTGAGGGISWTSKDWDDGRGYRPKVRFVPEGYTEVEVPRAETQSFAEFVQGWYGYEPVTCGAEPDLAGEHKYGYFRLDENGQVARVIDRTNPRKKWDWYLLGGRWTGFFQLKPGARGMVGRPGLMTPDAAPATADQARKGDIDFGTMRLLAEAKAAERWDQAHAVMVGQVFQTWEQIRSEHGDDIEAAREAYHAQPAVRALREARIWEVDEFAVTREEYTRAARLAAGQTFAVVKDGQWYERGEMGWFGCVRDEKDESRWREEFAGLIDGLPDDTLLSVYDCHI